LLEALEGMPFYGCHFRFASRGGFFTPGRF